MRIFLEMQTLNFPTTGRKMFELTYQSDDHRLLDRYQLGKARIRLDRNMYPPRNWLEQ